MGPSNPLASWHATSDILSHKAVKLQVCEHNRFHDLAGIELTGQYMDSAISRVLTKRTRAAEAMTTWWIPPWCA